MTKLQEVESKRVAEKYAEYWKDFFSLAFPNLYAEPLKGISSKPSQYGVIFNLDHYDEGVDKKQFQGKKGNPIELKNGTPIGYVAHVPHQEVKGVIVTVYGGRTPLERIKSLRTGNCFGKAEREHILSEGIAVIDLCLVDLLKLNVHQTEISEELQNEIHESIHKFYDILSASPGVLSPELVKVKEKPIVLSGASWGGLNAIIHAEKYPDSFDGYISINGGLSPQMRYKSPSFRATKNRYFSAEHVDPIRNIDKIEKPILILSNFNDNRVSFLEGINWYEEAIKNQKDDFVRFIVADKGSIVNASDNTATGHSFPANQTQDRAVFLSNICHFVKNGLDEFPEFTKSRVHQYALLSKRNDFEADADDLFMAECFRRIQSGDKTYLDEENLDLLYAAFYYFTHTSQMQKKHFFSSFQFTDNEYRNGLNFIFMDFITYLKERDKFEIQSDLLSLISDEILNNYKASLQRCDSYKNYPMLPLSILVNNQSLQKILNRKYTQLSEDFTKSRQEAKQRLFSELNARSTNVKSMWQSVARKGLQEHKKKKAIFQNKIHKVLEYTKELEENSAMGDTESFKKLLNLFQSEKQLPTLARHLERILERASVDTKISLLSVSGYMSNLYAFNQILETLPFDADKTYSAKLFEKSDTSNCIIENFLYDSIIILFDENDEPFPMTTEFYQQTLDLLLKHSDEKELYMLLESNPACMYAICGSFQGAHVLDKLSEKLGKEKILELINQVNQKDFDESVHDWLAKRVLSPKP